MRIALVGDHDTSVKAHRAIPLALQRAREATGHAIEWEWLNTTDLRDDVSPQLASFGGIWCVPASPYTNTAGAIAAIRFARESGRAFLGTCGGFQHALLEYAEAVWGVSRPAHAETHPHDADPVIAPLACELVERAEEVHFTPGSTLARLYDAPTAVEEYHCRYGLSPRYREHLRNGQLRATALDANGDVRGVELDGHPFFVATLFQLERSALAGRNHPVVAEFVNAVVNLQIMVAND